MTKPDDDLQKILLGEVQEMKINIEDMCIDLEKKNLMMKCRGKKRPPTEAKATYHKGKRDLIQRQKRPVGGLPDHGNNVG